MYDVFVRNYSERGHLARMRAGLPRSQSSPKTVVQLPNENVVHPEAENAAR